ncbi:hypothetical protein EI94DRAFT_1066759 [Lactarius quietus]|nr:hypothetical protein EI94DRAFT_1066759 [Lactarius quietus]
MILISALLKSALAHVLWDHAHNFALVVIFGSTTGFTHRHPSRPSHRGNFSSIWSRAFADLPCPYVLTPPRGAIFPLLRLGGRRLMPSLVTLFVVTSGDEGPRNHIRAFTSASLHSTSVDSDTIAYDQPETGIGRDWVYLQVKGARTATP